MRCEIIAVGTELLLGQTLDSNSAWIAGELAQAGLDAHYQTRVGDNLERMVESIRLALERNEAVIMCGGLGPTQDDLTRFALAEVMGSPLRRDPALVSRIEERFRARGRKMPENNLLQADLPEGALAIKEMPGTAAGLICPVSEGIVYAVPGVPSEMRQMISGTVIPDLKRRTGSTSVIKSRTLRTWGYAESKLAELLASRIDALEGAGNPTLAFLASGIEGIKVRITAKASDDDAARQLLDAEEREIRAILGNYIFGVDEQTMESVVIDQLRSASLSLATAESLTGGLLGARITEVPGASDVYRGGLVAYASDLKHRLLGVPEGPVVSEASAASMATGIRRLLDADVGLATTGVAGPAEQEGQPVGTVYVALAMAGHTEVRRLQLGGVRRQIRQFSVIGILNLLRLHLSAASLPTPSPDARKT